MRVSCPPIASRSHVPPSRGVLTLQSVYTGSLELVECDLLLRRVVVEAEGGVLLRETGAEASSVAGGAESHRTELLRTRQTAITTERLRRGRDRRGDALLANGDLHRERRWREGRDVG